MKSGVLPALVLKFKCSKAISEHYVFMEIHINAKMLNDCGNALNIEIFMVPRSFQCC